MAGLRKDGVTSQEILLFLVMKDLLSVLKLVLLLRNQGRGLHHGEVFKLGLNTPRIGLVDISLFKAHFLVEYVKSYHSSK